MNLLVPALLVVALLWLLGAYNRLVRLRMALRQSVMPLASLWRQREALALTLGDAVRRRPDAEVDPEVVNRVLATARAAGRATDALQASPLDGQALLDAAAAEWTLGLALVELSRAMHPPAKLSGPDAATRELLVQHDALLHQIDFARQLHDHAAQDYNAALPVFPTTLAAALFRFRAAPRLPESTSR